jgi:fumarate reductase subunit D
MERVTLQADLVHGTVEKLLLRMNDRFPGSGLSRICERLREVSRETGATARRISRPIYLVKGLAVLSAGGVVALVVYVLCRCGSITSPTLSEVLTTADSAVNLVILFAVAFISLWSLELRIRRGRVIAAIRALRDLAHVIDMHQLTKDPDGVSRVSHPTKNSPARDLSAYDLGRYLNYCTEMLSLISKLGYLYVATFDDPVAAEAANDLEDQTTGLSRKIWQKIMILRSGPLAREAAPPAGT